MSWTRRGLAGAALALATVPKARAEGFAARAGTLFRPPPADPWRAPAITRIALPDAPGLQAIWGALGRDRAGRIWAGISAGADGGSALLCRHDPATGQTVAMGDVLGNLRRLGLARAGEGQIKIHSRIVEADDGRIYFTSTDEEGEVDEGDVAPPRWGSHIWRTRPDSDHWEHLLAVPEGLTCGAGFGRWYYALGLWGHVLYRLDTVSGDVARVVVGAPGGHMSRNFVVDRRGHAFVPRVRLVKDGVAAELVEFTPALHEVAATPLPEYSAGAKPGNSHGITGLVTLADGATLIAASSGALYRIDAGRGESPAPVRPLGWFDPAGRGYVSGLQSWDGGSLVAGLVVNGPGHRHLVVRDLAAGTARTLPLNDGLGEWVLLYGSQTEDAQGRFYVGGRYHDGPRLLPVLLRLAWGA
ncbi:MAG TPA: hypothetical protein VL154_18305 [Acetobacteraceae bacterium]|jgi:hypothetical protein|nr:hypothetical protein [Acetobacteraceae bacterium]